MSITQRERDSMCERGIVQKVNENALSLNLFLPLPSAFPAPFRSPILINKYANANYRCCCCCRFYPLATFRTMRFGIAIPGCIALSRPISSFSQIIDSGSTFDIFHIWNLNIQITGCKFAHPVLPPAPTPVQLSVAIASMRPTYFAYGLTPRNPFPSTHSLAQSNFQFHCICRRCSKHSVSVFGFGSTWA